MQGDQRGHGCIDEGLGNGCAAPGDGIGEHVVPDVAHQHQAAARQHELGAGRRAVSPIRVQAPQHRSAALVELGLQGALHQAEPVAIHQHLVGGGHRRHRILAVLNGGDGGLEHDVAQARGIVAAYRVAAIDAELDMQAVMFQQYERGRFGCALKPGERVRVVQRSASALSEQAPRAPARI